MKRDKKSSEHYTWGQNCDGWHLLKTDSLSVIQERMPPNTSEALHYHQKAQQFFYILSGQATFELEDEIFEVKANEGFYVEANKKHTIRNDSNDDLHFLVISEPKAHGDRTNI
ncbi:MAG: cupin domain-containing protein [Bacteroidia bacterium]|nr:cupin domain-containing protein [Bacteroidia bacterium]